jgi:adenine-specific DNA-methyltransferase
MNYRLIAVRLRLITIVSSLCNSSLMAIERSKNDLGQYFTPRHIAGLMLSLVNHNSEASVLEPSSGAGVFLDVLHAAGFKNVYGVEVDPSLAKHEHFDVAHSSFLTWQPDMKFDVVIGNPPYIRWKDLKDEAKTELKSLAQWDVLYNSLSDYLIPFISTSVEHLNDGGELVFVTPSFWLHTQHSKKLREWLLSEGAVSDIIHFGEATVFPGVASSIVIFRFVKGAKPDLINLYNYIGSRSVPDTNLAFDNPTLFQLIPIPAFTSGLHWTLASEEIQHELDSLEASCARQSTESLFGEVVPARLGDIVKIANGMVSGLDAAFKVNEELLKSLNTRERSAMMPVTKAYQLVPVFTSDFVYYIDIPIGLSEETVRKTYPHFYEHLVENREKLEQRYSYGRELPFWEWAFRRSESFFFNGHPKAFVPCKERLTSKPYVRFSVVLDGVIPTQDVTAFEPLEGVRESLEYLVVYLSIPEITDWVRYRGLMKGGVAEFSERPLSEVPVRLINWNDPAEVRTHAEILKLFKSLRTDSDGDKSVVISKMQRLVHQLLHSTVSA